MFQIEKPKFSFEIKTKPTRAYQPATRVLVSSEHMTGRVIQTPASILRTLQGHYCLVPTHKKYHKTCSNNFSKKKCTESG
jgi:hypothetical protein